MNFLRFLFGYYWNDPDSVATGYRATMLFCWIMLLWGISGFIGLLWGI